MHATTTAIDRQAAKIAEWMRVLLRPGQVVEIRALDPFKSRVFDTAKEGEVESLGQYAAQCSQRAKGVYYTPNPLKPAPLSGSGGSALDADVLSRAWLLVDCDPRQAKKVNATTAERVATLAAIHAVSDTLTAMGFAGIVHGDSGNGYHLMVPVELPNDDESYRMHADFLRHLEERFGTTFAEFDQKVKNAARIWKVPATVARKGPPSDERPHRFARLIHVPCDPRRFAQSNVEALKKLLALWKFRAVDPPRERNDDRARLIQRAAKYILRKDVAIQGQNGSDRAFHVACTLVCRFGLTQAEALDAIREWNERCVPPWSERELEHKIADAAKQPITNDLAGGRPASGSHATNGASPPPPPPKSNAPPGLLIQRASEIEPRSVEWLWRGRIPFAKLTTFAGVGGLGKTFVLCDIAARVSTGMPWPDETGGECRAAGSVVFMSAEDDADDTLVPRLMNLNADLERVVFLRPEVSDFYCLSHIDTLEKIIDQTAERTGLPVHFLAIDPPTAYLGGVNDHKNAELRGLLGPLKSLASRRRVAIVFNTHVTKPQGSKVEAMMRVMGSVAWVNAVRAAHMFARDPEDPAKRIMVGMKMNIAKERKGLAYCIKELPNEQATIEWLGEVDTTADEAVNREVGKSKRMATTEWLIEIFNEKREWRSDDFWASAKEYGIDKNDIARAQEKLGIPKARKLTSLDGSTSWIRWVPEDWEHLRRPPKDEVSY